MHAVVSHVGVFGSCHVTCSRVRVERFSYCRFVGGGGPRARPTVLVRADKWSMF